MLMWMNCWCLVWWLPQDDWYSFSFVELWNWKLCSFSWGVNCGDNEVDIVELLHANVGKIVGECMHIYSRWNCSWI